VSSAVQGKTSLLLVSSSYPPVLGGSEIEAQRVCAALIGRGHEVTVLCAGGRPMPDVPRWTDPAGVPVRIFARRWKGPLRDCAFALGVAWTLFRERRNYRLVYFLMQGLHLAAGLPVARCLGKPIVMKVSGSGILSTMRQSRAGRLELKWLRRWAYRVMILNKGMAEEAAAAGLQQGQLLWMPNPVDTGLYAPCDPSRRAQLRARLGIPGAAVVVLFVGRLAPEKELHTLLTAFRCVADARPDPLLLLVGDGPCREELERLAAEPPLAGRVRFLGARSPAQVCEYLQAGDIFALVSSLEGFSCSLLEAMSAGLPSVVSNIPANAQLIEPGVHGLHATTGDPDSIAGALLQLIEDPLLRERMGAAARERVLENYSIDRVVDRYEAIFAEIPGVRSRRDAAR
jgi:glycosyltransferase involved in cell wall biosynthesis